MVWHSWDESGGKAPLVVLFHGGAGSWRHWIRTIPALLPDWRVLAPDLPGLGESDMPPDDEDAFAIAVVGPEVPEGRVEHVGLAVIEERPLASHRPEGPAVRNR